MSKQHRLDFLRQVSTTRPTLFADGPMLRCAEAYAGNPARYSKSGIAIEAGCSRNDVASLIDEAFERGFLEINLNLPLAADLSGKLRNKFELYDAVVTSGALNWDDEESIRRAICPHVISFLSDFSRRYISISGNSAIRVGLDGGKTLFHAVEKASGTDLPPCDYEFTPLVLGPFRGTQYTASVVAHLLAARIYRSHPNTEVSDPFSLTRDASNKDKWTVELDRASVRPEKLDIIFVGIGAPSQGIMATRMEQQQLGEKVLGGLLGDICSIAIDSKGAAATGINQDSIMILGLQDLKELSSKHSFVVGVAGGKKKILVIKKVLENGYINALITDANTAEHLLKET